MELLIVEFVVLKITISNVVSEERNLMTGYFTDRCVPGWHSWLRTKTSWTEQLIQSCANRNAVLPPFQWACGIDLPIACMTQMYRIRRRREKAPLAERPSRRNPNYITKIINTFYETPISVPLPKFCKKNLTRKISLKSCNWLLSYGQKTTFEKGEVRILKIFIFGHLAVSGWVLNVLLCIKFYQKWMKKTNTHPAEITVQ